MTEITEFNNEYGLTSNRDILIKKKVKTEIHDLENEENILKDGMSSSCNSSLRPQSHVVTAPWSQPHPICLANVPCPQGVPGDPAHPLHPAPPVVGVGRRGPGPYRISCFPPPPAKSTVPLPPTAHQNPSSGLHPKYVSTYPWARLWDNDLPCSSPGGRFWFSHVSEYLYWPAH